MNKKYATKLMKYDVFTYSTQKQTAAVKCTTTNEIFYNGGEYNHLQRVKSKCK